MSDAVYTDRETGEVFVSRDRTDGTYSWTEWAVPDGDEVVWAGRKEPLARWDQSAMALIGKALGWD